MFGFILILPAGVFLLIAYFAVSRRSSPPVRRAALVTLIFLGLALIICLILIVSRPPETPGLPSAAIPWEAPEKPPAIDWRTLIAVILLLLGIIIIAVLRERRKSPKNDPNAPI